MFIRVIVSVAWSLCLVEVTELLGKKEQPPNPRYGKDSRQTGQSNGERSSSCARGYRSRTARITGAGADGGEPSDEKS